MTEQTEGSVMDELAINGGKPVREKKIYYGRQWIDEDDVEAVKQVLLSDYITCGPKVAEMEKTFCEYTGAKYAVAVANGTAALHCACIAVQKTVQIAVKQFGIYSQLA